MKKFFTVAVLAGLIFSMAPRVDAAALTAEAVREKIDGYVQNRLGRPSDSVRVVFPVRLTEIRLPAPFTDPAALDFRVSSPNNVLPGNNNFRIGIYREGRLVREERLVGRVEVLQELVITRRALAKGALLREDDLIETSRWVRSRSSNYVPSMEEAVGKRLTAAVPEQAVLKNNLLAEQILIRRGSNIRIILNYGAISLSAAGVSEQDGTRGSLIRVRSGSSSRVILARVIGEGLVEVDL